MTDKLQKAKAVLHSLANCHQAVFGYYELGEYRKAYIMCLECRSKYAELAALMSQLDAEQPDENGG